MTPLTIRPLSRDEVRGIDARASDDFAMPTLVLMENAGRGAAALIRERLEGGSGRVLILCGPGNNGGDGGVVARHLDSWGAPVRVVWLADPARLRGDALTQWNILTRSGVDQSIWTPDTPLSALLDQADWVVDGLLGTGLARPVEGPLRAAIGAINASGKPVLALDLPSGLDADRGEPLGLAVRATLTATFVAPKLGFANPSASPYLGAVHVVDIGVPRVLLEKFQAHGP